MLGTDRTKQWFGPFLVYLVYSSVFHCCDKISEKINLWRKKFCLASISECLISQQRDIQGRDQRTEGHVIEDVARVQTWSRGQDWGGAQRPFGRSFYGPVKNRDYKWRCGHHKPLQQGLDGPRVVSLTYPHVDIFVIQDRVSHTCALKRPYTHSCEGLHSLSSGDLPFLLCLESSKVSASSCRLTPTTADLSPSRTCPFTELGL